MSDERVWLRHKEHGGFFHCPADAAEEWAGMGWEPTDERPEEPNPVVAENLAAAAQAEQLAAQAAQKSKKPAAPAKSKE